MLNRSLPYVVSQAAFSSLRFARAGRSAGKSKTDLNFRDHLLSSSREFKYKQNRA